MRFEARIHTGTGVRLEATEAAAYADVRADVLWRIHDGERLLSIRRIDT